MHAAYSIGKPDGVWLGTSVSKRPWANASNMGTRSSKIRYSTALRATIRPVQIWGTLLWDTLLWGTLLWDTQPQPVAVLTPIEPTRLKHSRAVDTHGTPLHPPLHAPKTSHYIRHTL